MFDEVRPQAVIHTAALADIDVCQAQPELARAVNVNFTSALAELCADTAARLVFCSTDTIFDGEHAPYSEADVPGPVNFYAETKVEAERIVSSLGANAVIARLSLVMGLPTISVDFCQVFETVTPFLVFSLVTVLSRFTAPGSGWVCAKATPAKRMLKKQVLP